MKFNLVLFALLGNALARVITTRNAASGFEISAIADTYSVLVERENATLVARSDDDWTLVVYEDASNPSGQQCGGTSQSYSGSVVGRCISGITNAAKCVDFSVSTRSSVMGMECTAKFLPSKCGDTGSGSVTDAAGTSTKGYNTADQVHFINIECERQQ